MTDSSQNFSRLQDLIAASNRILMAVHEKPDGDALGSMLAMAFYFDDLNKTYHCYSRDNTVSNFYYLPGIEKIKDSTRFNILDYDLIIFIDAGDINRTGLGESLKGIDQAKTKIVNIDHHLTVLDEYKSLIGLNIINLEASSVSEIIYQFFKEQGIKIDKNKATNLLTGIITDTGCFSNLATTITSFSIAAELLNRGVNLKKICDHFIKNKNLSSLKLWGRALSRLEKDEKTGAVTSVITQEDLEECGVESEATEGISNFLNTLSGAKYTLLLKEEKNNVIKGSLRTTNEAIDVSKIAATYGGGGHKRAAGFSVKGRLKRTAHGWEIERLD